MRYWLSRIFPQRGIHPRAMRYALLYGKLLAVRWQQQASQEIRVLSFWLHQLRNHSGAAAPHAEEGEADWRPQLPSSRRMEDTAGTSY